MLALPHPERRSLRYVACLLPATAAISMAACAGSVAQRPVSRVESEPASERAPVVEPDASADNDTAQQQLAQAPEPAPAAAPKPPDFSDEERQRIAAMQRFVATAARKHQLPSSLINAVIWVESRFTPRARGRHGPRGLMQIMPKTGRHIARELGRRYEPYSVDFNVDAGAYYLARMIELFDGDVALGLSAYATGPARVRAAVDGGEPLSERAQRYAQNVLAAQAAFEDEDF